MSSVTASSVMASHVTAQRQASWPDRSVHPGAFLAQHLEARGLSQMELAEMAGLSLKLVSGIISGSRAISARTAVRLERVLGVETSVWHLLQARWNLGKVATAISGTQGPSLRAGRHRRG
jgi:addiction module HigA family antidote